MADVFCLSFVAGLPGIGDAVEVALLDEGDAIAVTEDNRREYVEAYVDCILNASIEKQVCVSLPCLFCVRASWGAC